jgi:uncharacterized repeat protein (TIGR01451 family)
VLLAGVSVAAIVIAQEARRSRLSPLERLQAIRSTAAGLTEQEAAPSNSDQNVPSVVSNHGGVIQAGGELVPQSAADEQSEIQLTAGLNQSAGRKMRASSNRVITSPKTAGQPENSLGAAPQNGPQSMAPRMGQPTPAGSGSRYAEQSTEQPTFQPRDAVHVERSAGGEMAGTQTSRRPSRGSASKPPLAPAVQTPHASAPPQVELQPQTAADPAVGGVAGPWDARAVIGPQNAATAAAPTHSVAIPVEGPIDTPTAIDSAPRSYRDAQAAADAHNPISSRRTPRVARSVDLRGPALTADDERHEPVAQSNRGETARVIDSEPADDVEQAPRMSLSVESNSLPGPRMIESQAGPTADGPVVSAAPVMQRGDETSNVLLSLSGPQLSARATGPRRIVVSRESEYTVVLQNSGDVEANDVMVTVNVPSWVDIASLSPSSGAAKDDDDVSTGRKVLWRINRLEANSQEKLKMQIIPRKSQPIDLAVRWTYAHAGSQTQVEVEEPLLQMVISGPSEVVYGETKVYNLTLSNPGTGDAEDVVVSLLPLAGKEEKISSTTLGTLRRGESKTIQVELAAGKAGALLVKAQAQAEGGLTADATKEVLVRRADLKIEIVGPPAQYAGNAALYRLRIANPGNATAQDVTVVAVLPQGTEFVRASDEAKYIKTQGRIRWDLGSLAAGQQRTMDLTCLFQSEGANPVRVAAQDNTDLAATGSVTTDVIVRADLKLTVSDPQGPVPVGEDAVYELRLVNRGTKRAENIEAVVFFSDGIEPNRVEGADHQIGQGQVVFKSIPQLAAGGEMVLKIRAKADRPGDHIFRAEVLCRSLGTKLAAEETTHYYGKELGVEKKDAAQTASRPREPLKPAPLERY